MTMTRRPGERDDMESAARRPRPNVERPCARPLRPKPMPVWPAFFAARIASPTKLFGRFAPRAPCWMRPGWMLSSSSRVVIGMRRLSNACDGARRIELVESFCGERQQVAMAQMPKIPNPTNHMRPTAVGAFILPSAVGAHELSTSGRRIREDSRKPSMERDIDHCG